VPVAVVHKVTDARTQRLDAAAAEGNALSEELAVVDVPIPSHDVASSSSSLSPLLSLFILDNMAYKI